MLEKIRKSVFETNSSSTHSICITKKSVSKLKKPERIYFKHGEFGWENRIIRSTEEKASYLYQAICDIYEKREKEDILNTIFVYLNNFDINSEFEPDKMNKYGSAFGYIDHCCDLKNWVETLIKNEKRLIRYLCSEESFVHTGNDNSDTDIDINVSYKHEEYYKGN